MHFLNGPVCTQEKRKSLQIYLQISDESRSTVTEVTCDIIHASSIVHALVLQTFVNIYLAEDTIESLRALTIIRRQSVDAVPAILTVGVVTNLAFVKLNVRTVHRRRLEVIQAHVIQQIFALKEWQQQVSDPHFLDASFEMMIRGRQSEQAWIPDVVGYRPYNCFQIS